MKDFRLRMLLLIGAFLLLLPATKSYAQDPAQIYCCDSIYIDVTSDRSETGECCFTLHAGIRNNFVNCPMYPYFTVRDSATGSVLGTGYNSTGNTVTLCNVSGLTLIVEFYSALPPNGVILCTKIVHLPPCASCDCDHFTVTKKASVPPAPNPNCCFDVEIDGFDVCDVTSITIDDTGALLGVAYLTNGGLPLSFPILVEDLCGGAASGTFRFTLRDASGQIICTKDIPYNCGPLGRQSVNSNKNETTDNSLSSTDILLSLNPNPSNGEVNITFAMPEHTVAKVELYSSNGNLIDVIKQGALNKGEQSIRYNVSKYAIGTYQIRVSINGATYSIPLVITR
ncbi:MAG: T9SS type A sorting domain-containing protein [Bacteroidota bacterium]